MFAAPQIVVVAGDLGDLVVWREAAQLAEGSIGAARQMRGVGSVATVDQIVRAAESIPATSPRLTVVVSGRTALAFSASRAAQRRSWRVTCGWRNEQGRFLGRRLRTCCDELDTCAPYCVAFYALRQPPPQGAEQEELLTLLLLTSSPLTSHFAFSLLTPTSHIDWTAISTTSSTPIVSYVKNGSP